MTNIRLFGITLLASVLAACGGGSSNPVSTSSSSSGPDGNSSQESVSSEASSSADESSSSEASHSSFADTSSSESTSSSSESSSRAEVTHTSLPFYEDFDQVVDASGFFSVNYRALATEESAFYYSTGGTPTFSEGRITFGNARFTLANKTADVDTASGDTETTGEFDLSQPYRISFCVLDAEVTGSNNRLQVYVDNNTTSNANSIHGSASRLYQERVDTLALNQRVVIDSTLGTEASFVQLRAESGAIVTIDDLWIGYQSDTGTEPGSDRCSGTSSSSSSSSSAGSAPLVEDLSHRVPAAPVPTPPAAIPGGDRTVYVATHGSNNNSGTEAQPYRTLLHAVNNAQPGDVIVMRGGVYETDDTIRINNTSGTADKPITVFAYPGEQPVLDFTPQTIENNAHGVRLNASHWHLYGLTIRYAGHNGLRMDGSHNRLERLGFLRQLRYRHTVGWLRLAQPDHELR